MQNLVAVSYTVCANVEGPKKTWDAGIPPLGVGRGRPARNTLPTCITTQNFAALGQTVWV